jgi:hypothetical protein
MRPERKKTSDSRRGEAPDKGRKGAKDAPAVSALLFVAARRGGVRIIADRRDGDDR